MKKFVYELVVIILLSLLFVLKCYGTNNNIFGFDLSKLRYSGAEVIEENLYEKLKLYRLNYKLDIGYPAN